MANNNSQQTGSNPPPKPWERAGSSSGPAPFKPSSPGSTSDVVEASGTARPGEIVNTNESSTMNTNALGRPVPARPWMQQNTYGNTYGGYGAGTYGSYGGLGGTGSYNTGLYGSNMYGGGYGGLYGGAGGGMYGGGGMYNNNFGGPMGAYGMGSGGPFGDQDPNNPFGAPSSPPGFWMSLMRVMHGVVTFFGRVAILIDENAQAFHMFMSALLQLFDRSGMLYGELARFVFRLFGIRTSSRRNKIQPPGHVNGPNGPQNYIEPPKSAPTGSWDGVWGNN
ncbi:peroxisomal membrane protein 13-like isoform X2 [Rutidosis leptorrhynchoides]|uniref:peroxisomal membrane protein 13-like isoform X2 n=1 Tax=Rutidosis leptorrhynchoides TaxID=125765 RepID=UPI003A9A36CF